MELKSTYKEKIKVILVRRIGFTLKNLLYFFLPLRNSLFYYCKIGFSLVLTQVLPYLSTFVQFLHEFDGFVNI